jgi:hypothetical protein
VDLHGAKQLVRFGIAVHVREGAHQVVPPIFRGLLDVELRPGADLDHRLDEQLSPRSLELIRRHNVVFVHLVPRCWGTVDKPGRSVDNLVRVVNTGIVPTDGHDPRFAETLRDQPALVNRQFSRLRWTKRTT